MSGGKLANRYALVRPLGSGGMGRVWLARDEMLDREVAVKELTLPEGLPAAERAELVTRAVREAQATARLRHPGIVALHDVIVEHDRPWLVMELLRGSTLGEAVQRHGPMPQEHAARIGADVLEALSAAHAQGLQHRDVKPGNVFLTDGGRVVLTDFGIARQEGQAALTEQGVMIGSPGFIAPERLEGDPGGPASDVWSLGATLYVAVEGRPMYDGAPGERITATLTVPPPRAAGPVGEVVAAMTARHPVARPDAWSARNALRQVAAGQAPQLPHHDATVPTRVRRRGRSWLWAAAAVTLAAVAVAVAFVVVRGRDDAPPEAFAVPMDVCSLLTQEEVGRLLRTQKPPKGQPGSDEEGPACDWPAVEQGVGLQVQKDSDTPDPWSMTPATAHTLFENQKRYWGKFAGKQIDWTWPEIGAEGRNPATLTSIRPVGGLGEEAFAHELKGPTNMTHSAYVYYRLANLVVRVHYSTLADRPSDEDIRQNALSAARAVEGALRRAD
ncbi:protein kinase domain-containing protein [Nonomuraea muscovyensis]|uniref:non-specific serine/threonine protein kinase n=1 Tax=Nonomuraea muscovyensis TaxID=1124761 RepID=A0A7X0EWZ9_9ACTN|nr:serine/threonine-protein kinase [Nonomuraea muscovyensis]MBB6344136.1 serine/threonine protein kinase [Nonomuraea muscovyensis]